MDTLTAGTLQWVAALIGALFILFVGFMFGGWAAWLIGLVNNLTGPDDDE